MIVIFIIQEIKSKIILQKSQDFKEFFANDIIADIYFVLERFYTVSLSSTF